MALRQSTARLLADSRSAEPRARLAQAMSRSEFLSRIPRTLTAMQNPMRGLEALADLLHSELVDFVQIVVRQSDRELVTGGGRDEELVSMTVHRDDVLRDGLERVMQVGVVEEVLVPASGPERARTLESFVTVDDFIPTIDARLIESLVVLPLVARGRSFGVVVLGRDRGRRFTGSHAFLAELAERISHGLDTLLALAESRRVAKLLTASLVPREFAEVPGLATATFFQAAHRSAGVGGDFYALHGPDDDITVTCGDVAGKGVTAAIMAKRLRNAVSTGSQVDRDPGWLLGLVNRVVWDEAEEDSEQISTLVCLRLRPADEGAFRVDVASAGHTLPLVLRADGTLEAVSVPGVALCVSPDAEYDTVRFTLHPGDTIVLHTDGVTEARSVGQIEFGDERLRAALRGMAGAPPRAVIAAISVALSQHLGDSRHDDIAVVALQARP